MFMRLEQVVASIGLSKSRIYALMEAGKFPKQVRIGERAVAWDRKEIEAWAAARLQERDAA